jgi:hypothetical protein
VYTILFSQLLHERKEQNKDTRKREVTR